MPTTDNKNLNGAGLSQLCSVIKGELADKQDTLTAGTNITIENNVISATGGGSSLNNILDGSQPGSVRTSGSAAESSIYTIGEYAFAEGLDTTASGHSSHAEGSFTTASKQSSHAEGYQTQASSNYTHAEGRGTTAQRESQHVQGQYNVLDNKGSSIVSTRGQFADIVGNGTTVSNRSNASALDWDGNLYISGKIYQDCTDYSTNSSGLITANCGGTPVGGGSSLNNILDGSATGSVRTVGTQTTIGQYAFAEGNNTKANGYASHAEGWQTTASGDYTHAEGYNTTASGYASHAEGSGTMANNTCAHAEGSYTTAQRAHQHVQGTFNVLDNKGGSASQGQFADIVGNGTPYADYSNASALDWEGNQYLSGDVYVNCTDYTTNSSGLVTAGCGGTKLIPIPEPPSTGTYVLKAVNGVISWVAE